MLQIKKEIENIWEFKVDNNANFDNFVRLWKNRIEKAVTFAVSTVPTGSTLTTEVVYTYPRVHTGSCILANHVLTW